MLLIQARNALEQTLADLRRLIGDPPDSAVELDAVARVARRAGPPADGLWSRRLATRGPTARPSKPALLGATDRREASVANKRPVISVGGGVDLSEPQPPDLSARGPVERVVGRERERLSWTFWDFGRTQADIAGARAAERAARERLAEFDTTLDLEVRQRRLDLDSARRGGGGGERLGARGDRGPARRRRALRRRRRDAPPTCSMRRWRCCRPGSTAHRPSPTCGWPKRGSTARWDASHDGPEPAPADAIVVRDLTRRFGELRRRGPRLLHREDRRDLRVPRQQRRRQVHDDPHAVRPAEADVRRRDGRRARRRPRSRGGQGGASATCRRSSRCTSC